MRHLRGGWCAICTPWCAICTPWCAICTPRIRRTGCAICTRGGSAFALGRCGGRVIGGRADGVVRAGVLSVFAENQANRLQPRQRFLHCTLGQARPHRNGFDARPTHALIVCLISQRDQHSFLCDGHFLQRPTLRHNDRAHTSPTFNRVSISGHVVLLTITRSAPQLAAGTAPRAI